MFRLLILLGALLVKETVTARLQSEDSPALVVECGSSAAIPANISHYGSRLVGGVYTAKKTQHRCQSRLKKKGPIYVHVIQDVWRADCGGKVSEDGRHYSIIVHVQHRSKGQTMQKETTHTLSCYYNTAASVQDQRNTALGNYEDSRLPTVRSDTRHSYGKFDYQNSDKLFENQGVQTVYDKADIFAGSVKKYVSMGLDNKEVRTGFDERNIPTEFDLNDVPVGFHNQNFPTGFNNKNIPTRFDKKEVPIRFGKRNIPTRFDKKNTPREFDNKNIPMGLNRKGTPTSFLNEKNPEGLDHEIFPTKSVTESTPKRFDHKSIPTRLYNRHIPKGFKKKNKAPESVTKDVPRGLLSHLYHSQYSSRLVNDMDERVMVPVEQGLLQQPLKLSKGFGRADAKRLSASASVLQLNLVNMDGSMTAVVYPGKQVALELNAAQQNTLGVPLVTSCKVTNPLDPTSMENVAMPPFSSAIILYGCGEGNSLSRGSGFTKSQQGFTTPYFPVPSLWTHQRALVFSCDVTICADVMRCQQKCPPQHRKPFTAGVHDMPILLESQVVTSCPSVNDANNAGDVRWDKSLLPECLPEEHNVHKPRPPSEPDQNITNDSAGSAVNQHSFPVFWLAGNLHYIIIISLLSLLLLIFMVALFCKMAAIQRHMLHARKEARREAAQERSDSEHQDQMTQTPRPLPRTPHARGQTPNRHSRQGGDGASVTVLQLDDGHGGISRPPSGVPLPLFDHRRNSLPIPPPVPQQRSLVHPRPQPYDIPPNHEQQREFRTSVSSEPGHGMPYHYETSEQSSKVKSFQSSTTVEEKNSERHTTIIEIKNPGHRESMDNGMAWNAHEHLATFTGGAACSGNNILERGVVLGINSLKRHLDREHQQVSSQPRDRRPITAQQCESLSPAHPVSPQMYYNTPSLCSEDSGLKELMLASPPDGGLPAPTSMGGIRTTPHRGSRKGGMPVVINTVEETTRL